MKKKIDKELILFIILFSIFLLIILISGNLGDQYPDYSILNKSEKGYSIFYEVLKKNNYPVGRTLKSISDHNPDSIQLITTLNFENRLEKDDKLEKWIEKGGVVIAAVPKLRQPGSIEEVFEEEPKLKVEEKGKGSIIKIDSSAISNLNLIKGADRAYKLLTELEGYKYDRIYFNERNLFAVGSNKTFWDVIPRGVKIILYQLAIVLAAFFYYHGRRFGKIRPLQSEVEREENEYIYSAAALYRQAGCWDLILKYYYNDFLKKLGCSHESWLQYWQRQDLPLFDKAEQVYEFMDRLEEDAGEKKCTQIITNLEELKEILKKRRDEYWKKLKEKM